MYENGPTPLDSSGAPPDADALAALRAIDAVEGPAAPVEHGAADHLALVYDTSEQQFAVALQFVRQGLERDERCVYVAHDHSRAEVLVRMRAHGIDVDAALSADALDVSTRDDFLAGEPSSPDDQAERLAAQIEDATDGFEGLRVAVEMTWFLGGDDDFDGLVAFEEAVNRVFSDEDVIALCQYDRERFPEDVLAETIRAHPHVIYDGAVCHNPYYVPPEEFFGERESPEVTRMMEAVREEAQARTALRTREENVTRFARITADPDRSFEEQLTALFDLGCEWFGLELGALAKVDPEADRFRVEYASGDGAFQPGTELPLSETYCSAVTEAKGPVSVTDPFEEGYGDAAVREAFGFQAYLGSYVAIDGGPDRTFFFVSTEPRDEPFPREERVFHELLGQWLQSELERRVRERNLRRSEHHHRLLLEMAPVPIATYTRDRGFVFVNDAAVEFAGVDDRSKLLGESPLSFVHPDDRPRARKCMTRVFEDRVPLEPAQFTLVEADGASREGVIAATPVEYEGVPASQIIVEDVTTQKERERELQRQNERLEAFADIVSHDLRNPLNVIDGRIQLARETGDDEHFDAMARATDRMTAIIEDTLTLAKQGDVVGETDQVDLADVSRTVWQTVETGDATLAVPATRSLQADEERLTEALANLFSNAVDHGGEAVTVTVGETDRGFYVADDGPGIPPDERDSVFDHGFTTERDGTGFGLGIVREIVQAHGWDITVTDSEAGGARFEITGLAPVDGPDHGQSQS